MAINGIPGTSFNPYTRGITPAAVRPTADPAASNHTATTERASTPQSVADAIKHDANSRAAQVSSPNAPDGVDQELWSVLTKEERAFFVKAGAMGPLTYGRFTPTNATPAAPIVRGGRLDIRA